MTTLDEWSTFCSFRLGLKGKNIAFGEHFRSIPLSDLELRNAIPAIPVPPADRLSWNAVATGSGPINQQDVPLPKGFISSLPRLKHGAQISAAASSRYVTVRKAYQSLFGGSSHTVSTSFPQVLFENHASHGELYREDQESLLQISIEAKKHVTYTCGNRSLFVTQRGHIGIKSNLIKKGDRVCVLFGGTMPFVLRSVEGGERERFRLLGIDRTRKEVGNVDSAFLRNLKSEYFWVCSNFSDTVAVESMIPILFWYIEDVGVRAGSLFLLQIEAFSQRMLGQ
ncbi:hypothetical protein N431DRAFT_451297 [Stipitochalara longipes BDJ]|nr:hypothetical protein N431DRAFT_451297 [Stipitochalara longipes BDJ]